MSSRLQRAWECESQFSSVCPNISFYTFLEFMIIFIGLPNISGGVTAEGTPASE
jgi:hypothetical protein